MWLNIILRLRRMDWWMLGAIGVLLGLSIVMMYSIEGGTTGFSKFDRQIIYAGLGISLCFIMALINYHWWLNYAYIIYLAGIVILVAVLLFGTTIHGTTGWFQVGGISLQPVEFIKIILMMTLARFFMDHAFSFNSWKTVMSAGIIVAIYASLILLQPDLGSAAVFIGSFFVLLSMTTITRKQVMIIIVALCIAAAGSWSFLADYQQKRILTFLDPASDPQKSGYNVTQSIISVGSGQWFGRGLGFGPQSQLHFLPERETDFIFAVIAEELGFIGALLVVGLIGFILWRLWRMIRHSQHAFIMYFLIGLSCIIFIQTLINVGMNIGIMPVTGIPLPFVSAGGSSLLALLIGIGIAQNCYIQSR